MCSCTQGEVNILCVYQAVHGPLIPFVPLNALVLHSLLELVKNIVLVFAFVFSHKAGKLLLQRLPGNLMGNEPYWGKTTIQKQGHSLDEYFL